MKKYSLTSLSGVLVAAMTSVFSKDASEKQLSIEAISLDPDKIDRGITTLIRASGTATIMYSMEHKILRGSPVLSSGWQLTSFGTDVAIISAVYAEQAKIQSEAIGDIELTVPRLTRYARSLLPWLGKRTFNSLSITRMIALRLLESRIP